MLTPGFPSLFPGLALLIQLRDFHSLQHCLSLLCVGVAARETAQALRTLAQAARGVAANTKEPQSAAAMLDSAQYVMEGSAMLIHEAHQALVSPGDAESQQRLAQVRNLLTDCIDILLLDNWVRVPSTVFSVRLFPLLCSLADNRFVNTATLHNNYLL